MNFDALMRQARKNEEVSMKGIISKPVNLDPPRQTKKVRADLVLKQEEEKRRAEADRLREARQQRDKLQKMEAEIEERERRMKEEEEKQDRLNRIHREAQERRAKLEQEQEKKKSAERRDQELRKQSEREAKQREREAKRGYSTDRDIFRRQQEEQQRRERIVYKESLWKKKEAKERMWEQARKLAKSLSKPSEPSAKEAPKKRSPAPSSKQTSQAPRRELLDLEEATHLQKQRERELRHAQEKKELRLRRASEIESRGESTSSDSDHLPHSRRKPESSSKRSNPSPLPTTSTSKEKRLGLTDDQLEALHRSIDVYQRYPNRDIEALSDPGYDSHDDHKTHVTTTSDVMDTISMETANLFRETVVSETIQFSPLDSVFTDTLVTTLTGAAGTGGGGSPGTKDSFYSPRSVTSTSEFFKESITSETTYSPRPLQDDMPHPISYSPSAVPTQYTPENFSDQPVVPYSPYCGAGADTPSRLPLLPPSSTSGPEETVTSETQKYSPESVTTGVDMAGISYTPHRPTHPSDRPTLIAETLVSETAVVSPAVSSSFTYSPQPKLGEGDEGHEGYSPKAIDDQILNTLCYSPINTEDLERLKFSPDTLLRSDNIISHVLPDPVTLTSVVGSHDTGQAVGEEEEEEEVRVPGDENTCMEARDHHVEESVVSETSTYSPRHVSGEKVTVSYTPATRGGNFVKDEGRKEREGREPEFMSPEQNSIEMTPNETEMVCGGESSESEGEPERKEYMDVDKDHFSKETGASSPQQSPDDNTREDEESAKQARLQELFGDETESDDEDPLQLSRKKQVNPRNKEDEEEMTSTQIRRNKLKELARKKGYLSDDDEEEEYSSRKKTSDRHRNTSPSALAKPRNFTELMKLADKKAEENHRSLQKIQEDKTSAEKRHREQEVKKKMALKEMERRRIEQEREKRRQVEEEKRRALERAKNRIPKVKPSDKVKPLEIKPSEKVTTNSKHSGKFAPSAPKSSSSESRHHPYKKKKNGEPKKIEHKNSFEMLMEMANQNSEKKVFGSGLKSAGELAHGILKARHKKPRDTLPHKEPHKGGASSPPNPSSDKSRDRAKHRGVKGEEDRRSRTEGHVRSRVEDKVRSRDEDKVRSRDHHSIRDPGHLNKKKFHEPKHEKRKDLEVPRRTEHKTKPKRKFHINPYMDDLDDDLDGFIDDSDQLGAVDVSRAIRSITGYDRRRYLDDDEDDCRDMEASFGHIAAEEARSARIAKKEDAEEYAKILAEEKRERAKKRSRH